MQLSKALDPHTGVTTILLILNAHTVPAGAAPVQLPGHGLPVVQRVLVHQGSESRYRWGEGLANYALLIVYTVRGR